MQAALGILFTKSTLLRKAPVQHRKKSMKRPFKVVALGLLALATAAASPAQADDYPNKPVRIISDSAPGSAAAIAMAPGPASVRDQRQIDGKDLICCAGTRLFDHIAGAANTTSITA
jgi:hypothetical protein